MWHCFIPSFFLKSCFLLALWTCLLWLLSSVYFSDNTDIWFLSQVIYVGCFFLPKYMGYILLFLCMYHFLIGYFIYYSNLGLPPPPPGACRCLFSHWLNYFSKIYFPLTIFRLWYSIGRCRFGHSRESPWDGSGFGRAVFFSFPCHTS